MAWIMPSFGRPEALRRLLDAPGGWPDKVLVLVNVDDPEHKRYRQIADSLELGIQYSPWQIVWMPARARFGDCLRAIYGLRPDEPFWGISDDDYFPITPDWHSKMVEAAGPKGIAFANNLHKWPSPHTCRVMGGELARAIGTIAPGTMAHNFDDDVWGRFADDFGIGHYLDEVIVEHRHHSFVPGVPVDATYERGSGEDFQEQARRYREWLNGDERREQCARVGQLLNLSVTATDLSKIKLAICVPIQNSSVDIAFHHSFHRMTALLAQKGVSYCVQEAVGGSHIGKAREQVLWGALKAMPDATHIMFIDDDMGWDAKLMVRMLCTDHDFVAVAGVKKIEKMTPCYNAYPDPQVLHPVTRFLKVRHVGFAFVLLKRKVIERLCEAYPELEYNTDGTGRQWALFMDLMWQQEGKVLPERMSEDFSFCERWTRIGGEIYIDQHASIIHAGRKEYTGAAADLLTYGDLPTEGVSDAA